MEDASITGNLLSNDLDIDDIVISVLAGAFTTLHGGTVAIAVNGSFIYTPVANFNGIDSFDYTVRDAAGSSDIGKATITIASVNDAPVAQDDNFNSTLGRTLSGNVLTNNGHGADSDVDGNSLSVQAGSFTTAQGQTVTVHTNGTFVFTPAFDFLGTDSFSYTLNDGQGGSDTATAYISVKLPAGAKTGHAAADVLFGGNGDNVIAGLGGDDLLYGGKGHDIILGGAGDDLIFGGKGNDLLSGGAGNDFIYADGGKDDLYGGTGDDWLMGSGDNDTLHGGAGRDTLFGNGGRNTYVFERDTAFSGADTIMDFDKKRDQIDISDVLHNFDPLHDAISHFVKVTTSEGKTTISVDADGTDNGVHFTAIAIIQGAGKLDLASMIHQDNLVI
jgi:Ca2+-binding RTX toxin-like protein